MKEPHEIIFFKYCFNLKIFIFCYRFVYIMKILHTTYSSVSHILYSAVIYFYVNIFNEIVRIVVLI